MPENKQDLLLRESRDLYLDIRAKFEQDQAAIRDAYSRLPEEQAAIHEVHSRTHVQVKQEYAMLAAARELRPTVVEATLPAFMLTTDGRVDFDYMLGRLVTSGACTIDKVGTIPFSRVVALFKYWTTHPPEHELKAKELEMRSKESELLRDALFRIMEERVEVSKPGDLRGLSKTQTSTKRARQGASDPKYHPAREKFLRPYLTTESRNAIAEHAEIEPSSLQRWHVGKSRLREDNLGKLAKYLTVDAKTIPND